VERKQTQQFFTLMAIVHDKFGTSASQILFQREHASLAFALLPEKSAILILMAIVHAQAALP